MAAPTTITVTGTFVRSDGTAPDGLVVFTPIDLRFINNGNIIDRVPVVAALVGGQLAQTLVQTVDGYQVVEIIGGHISPPFTIPAIGPVNLGFTVTPDVVGITDLVPTRPQQVTVLETVGIVEQVTPEDVLVTDQNSPIASDLGDEFAIF